MRLWFPLSKVSWFLHRKARSRYLDNCFGQGSASWKKFFEGIIAYNISFFAYGKQVCKINMTNQTNHLDKQFEPEKTTNRADFLS